MARIRTIKPEFWSSKTLASVSRESRLTFIGLWNLCDDIGVTLDIPKKIAGDLYPWEEISGKDIDEQLNELVKAGLIVRITENNKDFIIIRSWDEHQKVDNPSKHTNLPKDTRDTLAKSYRCEKEKEKEKEKEHSLSVPPNGESDRNEISTLPVGQSDSLGASDKNHALPVRKKNDYPMDFASAWLMYPARLGDNPKQKALSAWNARLKEKFTVEQMTDGIARYAKFCAATGKVGTEAVKHMSTFLGKDCAFLEAWDASNVRKFGKPSPNVEKSDFGDYMPSDEVFESMKTIEGEVVR